VTAVVTTRGDLAVALATLRAGGATLGLVPTMGALHDGHGALLDTARATDQAVVASIFVNPLQFGPHEDYLRYPRSFDADVERCRAAGVDLVWAPSVDDMYAAGPAQVTVSAGPLGDELEGAVRPGHFAGMLTVVTKLFTSVRPDRAYFGEKDYQQLTLVRRLAVDLDLGVDVVGVDTVREPDGLALSSRNVYLTGADRGPAVALSRALRAGAAAAAGGRDAVLATARAVLAECGVVVDYLDLRGVDLGPPPEHGEARLLVAATVGTPHLIDNIAVWL
jgi:pantoate--beta-alanine ligase